jgi:hypothetical protein
MGIFDSFEDNGTKHSRYPNGRPRKCTAPNVRQIQYCEPRCYVPASARKRRARAPAVKSSCRFPPITIFLHCYNIASNTVEESHVMRLGIARPPWGYLK